MEKTIVESNTRNDTCFLQHICPQNFQGFSFVCQDFPSKELFEHLPVNHSIVSPEAETVNTASLHGIHAAYVSVFYQKKWIGALYFQYLTLTNAHYEHLQGKNWLDNQFIRYIENQTFGLWVLGHLFHVDFQGYYFLPSQTPERQTKAIQMAVKYLASQRKTDLVLLKNTPFDQHITNQLNSKGFMSLDQDISMVMDIEPQWDTIGDYVSALSRKYQARAKKVLQYDKGFYVKELTLLDIIHYSEKIEKLYLQVANASSVHLGFLNANYFVELKAKLKSNFKLVGYFKDGALVAFYSTLAKGEQLELYYIGFDYEALQGHPLYLHMLMMGVQEAIAGKYKTLVLGRTALEAKAITGAKPTYLRNFLWIKNPVIGWAARRLMEHFKHSEWNETWKTRHPFRHDSGVSQD